MDDKIRDELVGVIDEYFHLALLANDKTFSDIYGAEMAMQEARLIVKAILNKFEVKPKEIIIKSDTPDGKIHWDKNAWKENETN